VQQALEQQLLPLVLLQLVLLLEPLQKMVLLLILASSYLWLEQ
jgi:hypothetical protein